MKVIGKTAEVRLRVIHPGSRAEAFDPYPLVDAFPAVLANSRGNSSVVELMEFAAVRLMNQWLAAGETSLGVKLEVTYLKAIEVEGEIRAVATCQGVSGRHHHFVVHAFDESGLIGSCRHTRTIVSPRGLDDGARRGPGRTPLINL